MSGSVLAELSGGAPGRRDGEPALALVAIGMSAGGLYGLKTIIRSLPTEFPYAVVIAQHVAAPSILPELLGGWTVRPSAFAVTGDVLRGGHIYVAPAEHHLVINPDGTLSVLQRGRVRFVRPSVDWLLESAAGSFGERAVAVVLSGSNNDGAQGARCIARAGGTVIVQDPVSCEYPTMPAAVIATGIPHRSLHPCEIGPALVAELSRIHLESPRGWDPFGEGAPAGGRPN